MIALDEEWLNSLRFTAIGGVEVDGLQGVGSEKVVLRGDMPTGEKVVLQTFRWHLGYYIKEIPPFLLDGASHDPDRLNIKLSNLVGDQLIDQACGEYHRLFSLLVAKILEDGLLSLTMPSIFIVNLTDAVPFLIATPGIRLRLQDIAYLAEEDDGNPFVTLNAPFRISNFRRRVRELAAKALAELEHLPPPNGDFEPERFADDPLVAWTAAVMDGFFTEDQFDIAANFIEQKFGALTADPRAGVRLLQLSALLDAYAYFLRKEEDRASVRRAVQFLARCKCVMDVSDHNGKLIASGMRALLGEPVGPEDC
jgi:hypothetical protein